MKKFLLFLLFMLTLDSCMAQEEIVLEVPEQSPFAITLQDTENNIKEKKLKEKCVLKHNVVICEQESIKQNVVGSVVYYPAMCGCVLSAKVINDLIN